jgi:hypothetical protein
MPRYYFHIREGATLSRDSQGQELADGEAAREEAISLGQALLGDGQVGLHRSIEIIDETGHVVDEINSRDILFHRPYPGVASPAAENAPRR